MAAKHTKPAAAPTDPGKPLANAKHEAVAQAYIADREKIGWRAYQAIYPNSSQHACETAFSRLLKNAEFAARCEWLMAQAAGDAVMSAREVLEELSKLGRSSIKNCIVDGDDTADVVKRLRDMDDKHAAAIQELTVETYTEGGGDNAKDVRRVKVKLHDKRGPLQDLGRYHKLFGVALDLGGDVIVEIKRFGPDSSAKAKTKDKRAVAAG